jgi:hypothetical protein
MPDKARFRMTPAIKYKNTSPPFAVLLALSCTIVVRNLYKQYVQKFDFRPTFFSLNKSTFRPDLFAANIIKLAYCKLFCRVQSCMLLPCDVVS